MASKYDVGGVSVHLDIDDKGFIKKTEEIQSLITGKITNTFKKFAGTVAATFAIKQVINFSKECEKLYEQQEKAEIQLATMMKNAGVYTKENFKEMKEYASEIQRISNYGDEFMMPIIADLSKAKLSTEQLKEATLQYVNLMASGKEAGMLSRVLEKPLEMSQSLRRMGILINQEELKTLTLEQQRAKVLSEIDKKYGGMAKAMASGKTQIGNAIGDLKEVLGSQIYKTYNKIAPQIIELINKVGEYINTNIIGNMEIMFNNFIITARNVGKIIKPVIDMLSELVNLAIDFVNTSQAEDADVRNLSTTGNIYKRADLIEKILEKYDELSENDQLIVKVQAEKFEKRLKDFMQYYETGERAQIEDKIVEKLKERAWYDLKEPNGERRYSTKIIQGTLDAMGSSLNPVRLYGDNAYTSGNPSFYIREIVNELLKNDEDFNRIFQQWLHFGRINTGTLFRKDYRDVKTNSTYEEYYYAKDDFNDLLNKISEKFDTSEDASDVLLKAKEIVFGAVQPIEDLTNSTEQLNNRFADLSEKILQRATELEDMAGNVGNWVNVFKNSDFNKNFDNLEKSLKDNINSLGIRYKTEKNLTEEEKETIKATILETQAKIENAEETRETTKELFILSKTFELVSQGLSIATEQLASNVEETDAQRAEQIREGGQIVNDSINNFLKGFEESGDIWGGFIEMFIGWFIELHERVSKYLANFEGALVFVTNLFDTIAEVLSPIVVMVEYLTAPLTMLLELLSVAFELIKPALDWFSQTMIKPLKSLMSTISSWADGFNNALTYDPGYDKIISRLDEIVKNLKSEKDAYEKLSSIALKIKQDVQKLQEYATEDRKTRFEKSVVSQIYQSTIAEIEKNELYNANSLNLDEYKSLIDEQGNINTELADKLLLQLQYSELDANDFYADMGNKVKDLISSLKNYQEKQNNVADNVYDLNQDLKEQNLTLQELETTFSSIKQPVEDTKKAIENIENLLQSSNAFTGNQISENASSVINTASDVHQSSDSSKNDVGEKLVEQQNKLLAAQYRNELYNKFANKVNAYDANYSKNDVVSHMKKRLDKITDENILSKYAEISKKIDNISVVDHIESWNWNWGGSWGDPKIKNADWIKDDIDKKLKGFKVGGYTGNIPLDRIAGFVHGQEFVVKAPYAMEYKSALENINQGKGLNNSALQNININIDSTVKANDPLSMIESWNKELRNKNLKLELKKL